MAIPDNTRRLLARRLDARRQQRWPNLTNLDLRYRGDFVYLTTTDFTGDPMHRRVFGVVSLERMANSEARAASVRLGVAILTDMYARADCAEDFGDTELARVVLNDEADAGQIATALLNVATILLDTLVKLGQSSEAVLADIALRHGQAREG